MGCPSHVPWRLVLRGPQNPHKLPVATVACSDLLTEQAREQGGRSPGAASASDRSSGWTHSTFSRSGRTWGLCYTARGCLWDGEPEAPTTTCSQTACIWLLPFLVSFPRFHANPSRSHPPDKLPALGSASESPLLEAQPQTTRLVRPCHVPPGCRSASCGPSGGCPVPISTGILLQGGGRGNVLAEIRTSNLSHTQIRYL